MVELPVVTCDGCGACCQIQGLPPFIPDIYGPGMATAELDALRLSHPDLARELEAEWKRLGPSGVLTLDSPCIWYDAATGRCRHYEVRPEVCREFEVGCPECLEYRNEAGINNKGEVVSVV